MGFLSVLSFAHKLIQERLQPGEYAIDATAGTGADTLFLAKTAGSRGHIYSFDIQKQALTLTQERLSKASCDNIADVTLLLQSHDKMEQFVPVELHGRISAVMFNLGYLPTQEADKEIITETNSTISALEAALSLLRPRGIITVVLYPGHSGGDEEALAVTRWASELAPSMTQSIVYRQLQRSDAPYVIAIEKKASYPHS